MQKLLSINAKILIMDEPTSSLTAKEIDDLVPDHPKAEGMREEGLFTFPIRLEELAHIVDRVTIMRDGQYITKRQFQGYDHGSDHRKHGWPRDQGAVPAG